MSDTYTRSVILFSLKMGHFTSLKRYLNISYISQIQFLSNILNTRKYLKELARIMYKGKSAKINLGNYIHSYNQYFISIKQ